MLIIFKNIAGDLLDLDDSENIFEGLQNNGNHCHEGQTLSVSIFNLNSMLLYSTQPV